MTRVRILGLFILTALVIGGLMVLPAPSQAALTDYDCTTATGLPQSECEALVAVYNATGGDAWTNNTDWLQTTTPCTWYGVDCTLGYVEQLSLSGNNLIGTIPPEIGNLSSLEVLYLFSNTLTALPVEIGNLTALIELSLWGNELTTLPLEIGNLTSLEVLYLSSNTLTALPSEIGNLTSLTELYLGGNNLTALPAEIGNLTSLIKLYLNGNNLTTLPAEIGDLASLVFLDLYGNNLTTVPAAIGNLTNLRVLELSRNQLTALPTEIGNLTNLRSLYLPNNQLTTLPTEIGKLTSLKWLYLGSNDLTALPAEIGNLTNLEDLILWGNNLTALPAEIGNLTNLVYLFLDGNNLTTLPVEIGNLTNLEDLFLDENPLSGPVPDSLTTLGQLSYFTFYETGWCVPETGALPAWLAGIDEVYGTGQICGLEGGQLSGTVTLPDGAPAAALPVNLYRSTVWQTWSYITTTLTSAAGTYQLNDLGQGIGIDYRVQFVDSTHTYAPTYYDNQPTIDLAVPITLTVGVPRTGIDAQLSLPQPPAAIIETEGGSVTTNPLDGTATINMPTGNTADITVTRVVTCTTGSPTDVTLILTPPGSSYTMTSIGGEQYQATIPAADITSDSEIVVAATCDSNTATTTVGHINLYDPSGIISDAATGQPVEGATVTLYQVPGWEPKTSPDDDRPNTCESNVSKDEGAPWSQPAPTDLGVLVDPQVTQVEPALSYQLTDSEGYYGWDVGEGCWYVEVVAAGYEPFTSPVVGVPPEVTDLDLALIGIDDAYHIFLPLLTR